MKKLGKCENTELAHEHLAEKNKDDKTNLLLTEDKSRRF
jgi:hypothetical protein